MCCGLTWLGRDNAGVSVVREPLHPRAAAQDEPLLRRRRAGTAGTSAGRAPEGTTSQLTLPPPDTLKKAADGHAERRQIATRVFKGAGV